MNENFLVNTPLFHGMNRDEVKSILGCMGAREKQYKKDECSVSITLIVSRSRKWSL